MNITIIGWYGTETIGDRAILAGLFNLFTESYGKISVKLGCLNTLLTDRTIDEDYDFFIRCANNELLSLKLFDSRRKTELDQSLKWADVVAIGGGPLMEIEEMYMVHYAFKKAKKYGKKTIIAGCGMGPFKTNLYLKLGVEIVEYSDLTIFRDSKSLEVFRGNSNLKNNCYASIDPAVFAAYLYKEEKKEKGSRGDYISVNFREPPVIDYKGLESLTDDYFVNIIRTISESNNAEIRLVPMHTYWIGDDDRCFLNRICRKAGLSNVSVVNKPMSLEETMNTFLNSISCYGMRFHAILLQTILNGKNVILDYTNPHNGKIINLLNQLGIKSLYINQYVSLVNNAEIPPRIRELSKINIDNSSLLSFKKIYIDNLRKIY